MGVLDLCLFDPTGVVLVVWVGVGNILVVVDSNHKDVALVVA